jgi:LysM repeat protein
MQDSQNQTHVNDETRPLEIEAPKQTAEDRWSQIWENLVRLGLGETSLRIITAIFSIVLILLVVWVMDNFYLKGQIVSPVDAQQNGTPVPTLVAAASLPDIQPPVVDSVYVSSISSKGMPHISQSNRSGGDIQIYEVQKGDTIFGIAQKFGLLPQTILWGNISVLADNVDRLSPGQKLNILPVDGVYYEWHAGDGLNGVSDYFKVKVEDIVNFPANHLDKNTIGDYAHPNIKAGTWLIVPGGIRDQINWSAPYITRTDPAVAKVFGAGFCGKIMDGPVGTGVFSWPTVEKSLSGYDYNPPIHYGIDIAGHLGVAIFAVDSGVVVYAGWNDWGYGNVIVIDHGSGWQSLYGHLNAINVTCGAPVTQGMVIGAMGSTGNSSGPHLHFELRQGSTRVNPWSFLQK